MSKLQRYFCWAACLALLSSASCDSTRDSRQGVASLAYSDDGQVLAVAHTPGPSGTNAYRSRSVVRILDAKTIARDRAELILGFFARGVIARPDGNFLYFGDHVESGTTQDIRTWGVTQLWSPSTGQQVYGSTSSAARGGLAAVAVSTDSQLLAQAAESIHQNITAGLVYEPTRLELAAYRSEYVSPDPQWFHDYSDGHGRMPLKPGRPMSSYKDMPADVYCVAFSPNSHYLVSGGYDKKARVWDVIQKKLTPAPVHALGGHAAPVTSVQFVAGGDLLSVDAGGRAVARHFPSGEVVAQADLAATPDTDDTPVGKHRVVVAPGGKSFALLDGRTVRIYSTELKLEWHVPLTRKRPSCVAFAPGGKRLAVGFDAGGVEEFDTETQVLTQERTF